MNDSQRYKDLSFDQLQDVDTACEAFEQALRTETPVSIESQLEAIPAEIRNAVFRELVAIELEWRFARDQLPDISEYQARFLAHYDDIIQVFFEAGRLAAPSTGDTVSIPRDTEIVPDDRCTKLPQRIGRYTLNKVVGSGSFGLVYRAHDEQLDRVVAIKVPHHKLVSRREDVEAYLAEAQNVAGLDHANIVPVYDFGTSDEIPCYIVSK